jgi:uncharacterized membrane protein YeaQ/YmgE (transglycosylase-associated protein family)
MLPTVLAQTVTVTFDVGAVITWAIIGLIAGFLAGALVRGRRFGLITSIIVGLVGALVGGFLFTILKIPVPPILQNTISIRWADIIVAFVGAVIVLLLLGLIWRRRV